MINYGYGDFLTARLNCGVGPKIISLDNEEPKCIQIRNLSWMEKQRRGIGQIQLLK